MLPDYWLQLYRFSKYQFTDKSPNIREKFFVCIRYCRHKIALREFHYYFLKSNNFYFLAAVLLLNEWVQSRKSHGWSSIYYCNICKKIVFFLSWPASFDLMKMISLADGFISFLYGKYWYTKYWLKFLFWVITTKKNKLFDFKK